MTTNDKNANAVGNQTDVHTGKRKDYDSNYAARRKDNKVHKNAVGDVSQADLDKWKAFLIKSNSSSNADNDYQKSIYQKQSMTTNDENANAVGNQTDVHTGKPKEYDNNYTARRKDNKVLKNGIGDVSQADIDKQKEHVENKREYYKQNYARQKANILKQIASGEGSSQHATAATNVTPRVAILVEPKNGVNAFRIAAKQGDL
nr:hypothetical protein [Tanacetum cinerariifolium]